MDQKLKERLVGATVIWALAVIFVPMLFEESVDGENAVADIKIPPYPGQKSAKTDPVESIQQPEKPLNFDNSVGKLVEEEKLPEATSLPSRKESGSPTLRRQSVDEFETQPSTSATTTAVEPDPGYVSSEMPAKTEASIDAVGAESKPNAGLSAWMIQVGSFEREENANEVRDTLRNEGFAAFVEAVESEQENFFRVRVGPELDRQRAEMKLKIMQKRFDLKGMIVSYPGD